MLSIEQLSTTPTRDEVAQFLINTLSELGFQTTGWQEGRVQTTLLNGVATVGSAFFQIAGTLARAGYNSYAEGAALTLKSDSDFDNQRGQAKKAKGPFLLTSTATVAKTIEVGALVIEDTNGTRFLNTEKVTVSAGSSSNINVEAALAGTAGNIGNNSTLRLVTPVSGITVTNPGPGDGAAWYTLQTGADEESNATLQQRNATKWGTLSVEKTRTAYENLALSQEGVEKTKVVDDNPRGAGTVDVYVAGNRTLVATDDITSAQEAFAERTFGTESAWPPTNTPLESTVELKHPTTLELDVQGVVYYDPNFTTSDVKTNLKKILNAFVDSVPIGGFDYSPGPANVITLGDLTEVIEATRGIRSATLSQPTGNVSVGVTQLVTAPSDWFTGKITFVATTT